MQARLVEVEEVGLVGLAPAVGGSVDGAPRQDADGAARPGGEAPDERLDVCVLRLIGGAIFGEVGLTPERLFVVLHADLLFV